jgi:lipid A 3-O-deacylase
MIKHLVKLVLYAIVFVGFTTAKAQLIDNTSTFRQLNTNQYFRFNYDNDYFTKTDEYYSQGITLDIAHPAISKFILAKLLWKPYKTIPQYGITFNLFGYTPTSIKSDEILYGDRPFEANITLKTYLLQVDDKHKQKVATAFSVGVMGKAALGFDIQYNIHRWTKNPLPLGWQNQIKNDVILNYQFNYEKQLVSIDNHFLLNAATEGRLGTLNTKASAGFNFMAGRFTKRFMPIAKKRKTEYYFYGQGNVNVIGYDATLQGGIFNRKSPYTIGSKDVNRITFQADAGVIVNFKKLYLSYTQSFVTKEFTQGKYHRWGGVSVGFAL